MNAKPEMTPAEKVQAFADAHGITMRAEFVPFSRSRHADGKGTGDGGKPWLSLNWRVTLAKGGRDFLATDYSMGSGNAPGAKASATRLASAHKPEASARADLIAWECELGIAGTYFLGDLAPQTGASRRPIVPPLADVLYSLQSDADVLNYGGFEDWAPDLGYDPDSRKAEAIWRACIEIALKLRAAIGDDGLAALAVACEDF